MKTKDFLKKHDACTGGAKWALSIGDDMADVWNAMIEQGKHAWLIWTATRPGVFPDAALRKLACRFVRETPLHDGRKVWALLVGERSRKAVKEAELYADGNATDGELQAACNAAYAAYAADAADAAADAAAYAADAAARAVAYVAARAAADAADAVYTAADDAKVAQAQMIADMGNPFKERAKQ